VEPPLPAYTHFDTAGDIILHQQLLLAYILSAFCVTSISVVVPMVGLFFEVPQVAMPLIEVPLQSPDQSSWFCGALIVHAVVPSSFTHFVAQNAPDVIVMHMADVSKIFFIFVPSLFFYKNSAHDYLGGWRFKTIKINSAVYSIYSPPSNP